MTSYGAYRRRMARPVTSVSSVLRPRALGRALLARQMLLARDPDRSVFDTVHHLVGLQAQTPGSPYVALWSRLAGFDPGELSALLTERRAVRLGLMRSTIHLVTADDCAFLRPLVAPVLARSLRQSGWSRGMAGLDLAAVGAAARALVDAEPLTFAVLGRRLAEQWPDRDPATLARAAASQVGLVQVPPRGVWGQSGAARLTSADHWLGRPLDQRGSLDDLVLRYLAAFGPASVMDVQAWSGLTRLREVTDGLGDRVVRFRSEDGRELLDVPGGPRPDPDVPAPVRFLPDYDNVVLGHADRRRIVDDAVRRRMTGFYGVIPGSLLVDGRVAGRWTLDRDGDTEAILVVTPFSRLAAADRADVEAEGAALVSFLAAGAPAQDVRLLAAEDG
jgi:hypothetical protein